MTYILEMASGKEYQGDDTSRPTTAKASGAPLVRADRQVEAGLALVEPTTSTSPVFPAGLYMDAMISKLED